MSTAHIIFVNDSPEAVVVDNEALAKEKLEELRKKDYEQSSQNTLFDEYKQMCYWHIHTVQITEEVKS